MPEIGDLVHKTGGYGGGRGFTGLVLGFNHDKEAGPRVKVLTEDGIEYWFITLVEILNETR